MVFNRGFLIMIRKNDNLPLTRRVKSLKNFNKFFLFCFKLRMVLLIESDSVEIIIRISTRRQTLPVNIIVRSRERVPFDIIADRNTVAGGGGGQFLPR